MFIGRIFRAGTEGVVDEFVGWGARCEMCGDTWCEGSFEWFFYDLRSAGKRSELTMRTYSELHSPKGADATKVVVRGSRYVGRVLGQHVVPSCTTRTSGGSSARGGQDSAETETGDLPLRSEPARVKPLVGVTQLAIGFKRTAAILPDGALATWGYGPIGDGRTCDGPPCDGLVPTVIPIAD